MSNNRENLLQLRDLELTLGGRPVLSIDEFALSRGSIVLLTGANGSGKTSLLKILAGLLRPQRAAVRCNGQAMSVRTAAQCWRGQHIYLHQQPYLFDDTVSANVAYGLRLRGFGRVQRRLEVRNALLWARLDHLADRAAHALSTGERQRVALTRAKILNPAALLVDEIIANMDAASREQSRDLLLDLSRSGVTVVVASHEAGQFDDIADQRLILERGRLVKDETTAKVVPLKTRRRT